LAKALSASNGKITPQAKEALAARRDTDDLLDECRILLSQVEKNMVTERFSFSEAAETYRLAYQNASKRWAEMNTFTVLVECGERICAAMAVCTMTKAYDHHEKIANDLSESSNVILGELQELLRTFNGDKKPYIAELGTYDIGLMSENEIMSPAEMHMARSTIVTQ
ncbi:MAG: hypothetical protein Q7R60_01115, partial [bacterium]|nr:hypothetical protein [bacterium]